MIICHRNSTITQPTIATERCTSHTLPNIYMCIPKQPFLTDNEQQQQPLYTQLLLRIAIYTTHKGINVAAASIRQRQQLKHIPSITRKNPDIRTSSPHISVDKGFPSRPNIPFGCSVAQLAARIKLEIINICQISHTFSYFSSIYDTYTVSSVGVDALLEKLSEANIISILSFISEIRCPHIFHILDIRRDNR